MSFPIAGRFLLSGLILFAGLCLTAYPAGEGPSLLPLPQRIILSSEKFYFTGEDQFIDPRIRKEIVSTIEEVPANMDEAYRIVVRSDSVIIKATADQGFFRAMSTLSQLTGIDNRGHYIRGCIITDWPAFRIRGFMHDTGRSFIPIEELKREVKILSRFKINTFHWHLTEDLAWRLESDIVSGLTSDFVTQRDKRGYYTKEEVAGFVRYCNEHFIEVIPEIDMPGHSAAFTRATGFTMQSEEGKEILRQLLSEACQLFNGRFFHIGTDEVKITDPVFVRDMMMVVRDHGKEVIGWLPGGVMDEIAIRQLWADATLPEGTVVIDSRYRYLNHTDYYSDLFSIFNSRICDSDSGSDLLAGGVCCIWNDRRPASVEDILVSNAFYPTMLAFAERSWLGGGDDIRFRGVRMGMPGDETYERFRNFESRMMDIRKKELQEIPFPYHAQADIFWKISSQYPNHGNLEYSAPFERDLFRSPGSGSSARVTFLPAAGAAVYLRHTWGELVPSFYEVPLQEHTAYAFTWVFSPDDCVAGLHFSTHNYGRSELDMAPPQGEWDHKKTRVWFNGEYVSPPVWKSPKEKPGHETPYTNEDLWSRPPVKLHLKKGWNSLGIKLPVGRFSTKETRLVKWMFTAMIVTPDGKAQPEGLVYSPERELSPEERIVFNSPEMLYSGMEIPAFNSTEMVCCESEVTAFYSAEMACCETEVTAFYSPEKTGQSGFTRFGQSRAVIPVIHIPKF